MTSYQAAAIHAAAVGTPHQPLTVLQSQFARMGDFFRNWRQQPARADSMRPGQMRLGVDPAHPGASFMMPSIPRPVADQLFARMEAEAQGRGHAGSPAVAETTAVSAASSG